MFAHALLLSAALTPAAPIPAGAQPETADAVLRRMDEALAGAKTLRIDLVIHSKDNGKDKAKEFFRGTIYLADGNRFRVETPDPDGKGETGVLLCDGKRMVGGRMVDGKFRPDGAPQAAPPWVGEVARAWLGRGGTWMALAEVFRLAEKPGAAKPGAADGPQAVEPKLLPDERVNGADARVVEYGLKWEADHLPPVGAVRVWVDKKTHLPLRRTMTVGTEEYTATHTRIEAGVKLDDTLFELPK